jgi:hypothetical protein
MRAPRGLCLIPAVLVLLLAAGSASRLEAQSLYIGGGWVYAVSETGDLYDENGANFTAGFKYGLPLLDVFAGGGWTWFSAKNPGSAGQPTEDLSSFDIHAGGLFNLALLGLGAKAGYWFGDLSEFDILPMAQVRFWKLFAGAEYKGLLGDGNWVGLSLGIRF